RLHRIAQAVVEEIIHDSYNWQPRVREIRRGKNLRVLDHSQLHGMPEGTAIRKISLREPAIDDRDVSSIVIFRSAPHASPKHRYMQSRKIFGAYEVDVCHLRFTRGFSQNLKSSVPTAARRVRKNRDCRDSYTGCFGNARADLLKISGARRPRR